MKGKTASVTGLIAPRRGDRAGRKPGPAVWKQIEEWLVAELSSGKYPPGVRLPTERELISRFGVGRHTLRQAMATLETKGLVRIEQGRGTFVHDQILHHRISERSIFLECLQQKGQESNYDVISAEIIEPSVELQYALGLQPNSTAIHLMVTAFSGAAVLANIDLYFDRSRFPEAARILRQEQRVSAVYRHYGIDEYSCGAAIIRSRLPTAAEARRLHQPKSRPIFVTKRIDVTEDDRPIGYADTKWCSDRVEFAVGASGRIERPAYRKKR